MPNLFSFLPVAILAWVSASTSGLTRIATGAVRPRSVATALSRRSSGTDSTLIWWIPAASAAAISAARLADPGKDDALGRHAGGERAAQLALRDDVGAGAEPGEQAQHGEVGIGLDRIADQRPLGGERLGKARGTGAANAAAE